MPSRTAAVAAGAKRSLPAVTRFLDDPRIAVFEALVGRENLKQSINLTLQSARRALQAEGRRSFESLAMEIIGRLQQLQIDSLVRVVNGTGILLHTNLGRAPLASAALDSIRDLGAGYSNLEFDVREGSRGSRYARASVLIREVSGAEAALVVNNCAAAVLLILDTFAKGREVIVARNQLIEIGGGFRLPEVLERSGAQLVEVGTTNKVYARDFERALSPRTALLMRAHPSNYRISGFTQDPEPKELVALGRRAGIPVIEDLGSGALFDLAEYGLPHERTVGEAIADGIDLVTFSGDKMLGGPQAGVIVGSAVLIARLRANPLLRALRIDKLTLAALIATLRLCAAGRRHEIPFFAMLAAPLETLRARGAAYVKTVAGTRIVESHAYAGGGSLPQSAIASLAIALQPAIGATAAAARLRAHDPPVVARIEADRLLLDLRTIDRSEDSIVIAALQSLAA